MDADLLCVSCCVPLRYVMEVIQRGRSAVRPPMFPPLSVVPAVSDSELSEPEYVLPSVAPLPLHLAEFSSDFCSMGKSDGTDLHKAAAQKALDCSASHQVFIHIDRLEDFCAVAPCRGQRSEVRIILCTRRRGGSSLPLASCLLPVTQKAPQGRST